MARAARALRVAAACGAAAAAARGAGNCSRADRGLCLAAAKPILQIVKNTADAGACCARCEALASCVSWNVNTEMEQCFLRAAYVSNPGAQCTSGKTRDGPLPTPSPAPAPTPPPTTPRPTPPLTPFPGGRPPHVLALLIDDYGWADAGWHVKGTAAAAEVRTPVLDGLVAEGIELERNYVFQVCSPSRSAAQTGRNPIHVNQVNLDPLNYNPKDNASGFQGVPRPMTGLAELLAARAGYQTHFFGKWDCGMATMDHTPRGRGYTTSLHYFHHMVDYWTSTFENANGDTNFFPACKNITQNYRPVDLWAANATYEGPARGTNNTAECNPGDFDLCGNEGSCPPYPGFPDEQLPGCKYEDEIFRDALLGVIAAHDASAPFFAFWAPHIVHSPLMVPKATYEQFAHVEDWRRRRYLAMVSYIDTAVGTVVDALKGRGMYDDLLIVMSSDNGGPVYGGGSAGASNYPLRGGKASNWEGGVRVNAFVSGGLLPPAARGRSLAGLTTLWDWYATIAEVAGIADVTDAKAAAAGLPPVDSVSQWPYWAGATDAPPRSSVALGDYKSVGGVIVDKGAGGLWKLLTGRINQDGWQGPSFPNQTTRAFGSHDCGSGCLFRIDTDPTEHADVAAQETAVIAELEGLRQEAAAGVFAPDRGAQDPQSCVTAMEWYGGFWGPWVFPPDA